jgi:CHAD domain-containing protein
LSSSTVREGDGFYDGSGARVAAMSSVAFRLRDDEPIGRGLHRVVKKELRTAAACLSDGEVGAIHKARKSIKKVRAVLQLVGDVLGANGAVKQLRRASHLLAPLRDADVLIETARTLRSRGDTTPGTVSARLDAHLATQQTTLREQADHDNIGPKAARAIDRVRRDLRDWHWKRVDYSALAKGLRRSYKRARTRMQTIHGDTSPEAFHEWRKRVKTLWYGLRLLEEHAPHLQRTIADFEHLQTWLGDDHNLVVLEQQLQSVSSPKTSVNGRKQLHTRITRRQDQLRRKGLAVGARLFADPPKQFVARHTFSDDQ